MPETSPVNQSKRMVKKQQMRWSPRGAHSRSAPGYSTTTLADDYRRWYPGFTHTDGRTRRMASHGLSRSPSRRDRSAKPTRTYWKSVLHQSTDTQYWTEHLERLSVCRRTSVGHYDPGRPTAKILDRCPIHTRSVYGWVGSGTGAV